jgi:hypothetical protein
MKFIFLTLILFILEVSAENEVSADLNKALAGIQSTNPETIKTSLTYILLNQEDIPSTYFLLASAQSLQLNRLEDAGYLYYAGQLRAKFDLRRFPPKQQGGNSPNITLISLMRQVGSVVNPEVFKKPKLFNTIITNLARFPITTKADYNPGWEYKYQLPLSKQKEILRKIANTDIKQLAGFSQLLNDTEYYNAFTTLQEFHLLDEESKKLQTYIMSKNNAENIMFEIELAKKIVGRYYKGENK